VLKSTSIFCAVWFKALVTFAFIKPSRDVVKDAIGMAQQEEGIGIAAIALPAHLCNS